MENQNIQWTNWEEQPQETNEQPQVNWGEQQQENIPTWGEQPQQEQPPINWSEPKQQETNEQVQQSWGEQPQKNLLEELPNYEDLESKDFEKKTSYLGNFNKIQINTQVWKLNYDNSQALQEIINNKPQKLDNDGKYTLDTLPNTELANIVTAIKKVGESQGLKIGSCFLLKNQPMESNLNISKDNPKYNFIYFLNASYDSGDVILDLSPIKGPSIKSLDSNTGILISTPGWVPFSISKNLSKDNMVAIVGTFI